MYLGDWQLDTLSGGAHLIDGGVMFGVVPRTLWAGVAAPDELNRVRCANHCVLARNGRQTVLVDTGYGGKYGALDRKFYALEPGEPLLESLATFGLAPADVDTVVLSHLHFDHVGGCTRYDDQRRLVTTFPRAQHVVGRMEWEDATGGAAESQSAYASENLQPLEASGRLVLVDDGAEVLPGLHACLTGGHTRGHLALRFESAGQTALFISDFCPTTAHVRQMWCTAYDTYPLETRRRKPQILAEAAEGNWWILWYHDPRVAASRLQRHARREFAVIDPQPRL
jgi:glyoxylase-like metal-dependent hydrolase (beta-lactamase superfamily II)